MKKGRTGKIRKKTMVNLLKTEESDYYSSENADDEDDGEEKKPKPQKSSKN
jgi:hypothetical protein